MSEINWLAVSQKMQARAAELQDQAHRLSKEWEHKRASYEAAAIVLSVISQSIKAGASE